MREIAADEVRHAELALAIARWADMKLDESARARVSRARLAARRKLERDAATDRPEELIERAGLPAPSAALSLLRGLA
jgi:hypothetical protein